MHTRRRILAIVAALAAAAVAGAAALITLGGAVGLAIVVGGLVVGNLAYRIALGPWHRRWNATADEAADDMCGDGLVPVGASTTRAITIDAPPEAVWPWLVQLGWRRAGWYSYDWIDNDGRPSADRIVPALQHLAVGDQILMAPGLGFTVRTITDARGLVAQAGDGTTWSLLLRPAPGGRTRLVSRFRTPTPTTFGGRAWFLLADPGAFVMERKMLRTIRARVESSPADAAGAHPTAA